MKEQSPQIGLFSTGPRNPLSRAGQTTSRLAERDLKSSGRHDRQLDYVLGILRANPGKTSAELTAIAGSSDRYLFARRLPDLEKRGLAVCDGFGGSGRRPQKLWRGK